MTPAALASSESALRIDRVTQAAWSDLLDQFDDANIYQTWAYGGVHWGDDQLSHVVLELDGRAAGLAQLRIMRVPLLQTGIAYLRWGPVCKRRDAVWNAAVVREMTRGLIEEFVNRRRLLLRIVPSVYAQDEEAADVSGVWDELGLVEDRSVQPYQTFRVDLRIPSQELRSRLSARWRRQLNIAERNNLVVIEGADAESYERFLSLYREMHARKRFETTVDVDEFRQIQQRLPATQRLLTFLCLKDQRLVAGLVVSRVGRTAIYLLAATGDDGLNARGSYLLQWTAMQRLKELGCDWYDLGGANEQRNPGVFTFKSGMGGDEAMHLHRRQRGAALSNLSVAVGEGAARLFKRVAARQPWLRPSQSTAP